MSKELARKRLDELKSMENVKDDGNMMPVDAFITEAETLYKTCLEDKDELTRIGLDGNLWEDMLIRIGALKEAQADWIAEFKQYQECQERWNVLAPEGFKFRDELLHHLYFALSDLPKEYLKVKMIAEGNTNDDMIQDLLDISKLGKRNIKSLEAISMDVSLLDKASDMSYELGSLLGDVNNAKGGGGPVVIARNKAFNHLKEAVDKIRKYGQYVFWRNEKKSAKYASNYFRKGNSKSAKIEVEEEVKS